VLASSGNGESSRQFAPWTIEQTVKMSTYMFPSPGLTISTATAKLLRKFRHSETASPHVCPAKIKILKTTEPRKLLLSFTLSESFGRCLRLPDADVRCTS